MKEIIKVNYNSEQPTVSARDLYEKVGTTERFASWLGRQLQFGFEQGKDYSNPKKVLRVQIEGNREVQREVDDYDLTIDIAKHLCFISKIGKIKTEEIA
ncbi:MAG: antA/AntB antirepressor family protein [Lachnospiraceae bacterium]